MLPSMTLVSFRIRIIFRRAIGIAVGSNGSNGFRKCPRCRDSRYVHRSRIRGADWILKVILIPVRCHSCHARFYSWRNYKRVHRNEIRRLDSETSARP
jgi:hypothetical protein